MKVLEKLNSSFGRRSWTRRGGRGLQEAGTRGSGGPGTHPARRRRPSLRRLRRCRSGLRCPSGRPPWGPPSPAVTWARGSLREGRRGLAAAAGGGPGSGGGGGRTERGAGDPGSQKGARGPGSEERGPGRGRADRAGAEVRGWVRRPVRVRAARAGGGGPGGGGGAGGGAGVGAPRGGQPRDARGPAGLPGGERRGGPGRWRRAREPGPRGTDRRGPGTAAPGRPCHGEACGRAGRPALEHGRLPARPHRQPLPPAHARLPWARYRGRWRWGPGSAGEWWALQAGARGIVRRVRRPRAPGSPVWAPSASWRASRETRGPPARSASWAPGTSTGTDTGDRARDSFPAQLESGKGPTPCSRPVGVPLSPAAPGPPAPAAPPQSLCPRPLTSVFPHPWYPDSVFPLPPPPALLRPSGNPSCTSFRFLRSNFGPGAGRPPSGEAGGSRVCRPV